VGLDAAARRAARADPSAGVVVRFRPGVEMTMRRTISLGLVLAAAMYFAPGCGGDSSSDNGGSGGGGTGGTEAGTGATGGASGGAAGSGATGGSGGTGGTAECVPTACPSFQGVVQGCCLPDNTCGFDGTALGAGCLSQDDISKLLDGGLDVNVPPDAADPNCDSYQVGGYNIVGCCASTGLCGIYNPLPWGPQGCVDWGDVPAGIPKPEGGSKACGDSGTGDAGNDASTDASGDAATD